MELMDLMPKAHNRIRFTLMGVANLKTFAFTYNKVFLHFIFYYLVIQRLWSPLVTIFSIPSIKNAEASGQLAEIEKLAI